MNHACMKLKTEISVPNHFQMADGRSYATMSEATRFARFSYRTQYNVKLKRGKMNPWRNCEAWAWIYRRSSPLASP
jgi:hypothetical protein